MPMNSRLLRFDVGRALSFLYAKQAAALKKNQRTAAGDWHNRGMEGDEVGQAEKDMQVLACIIGIVMYWLSYLRSKNRMGHY
ncbi:hypothetical protein EDD85DRAFT_1029202 [Armillaria nabsnona]|nr:hypothetical protein EDD85DRAFT_1029202 [Armillaria nabsnona]